VAVVQTSEVGGMLALFSIDAEICIIIKNHKNMQTCYKSPLILLL
jgi:hypothetical protein